MVLGYSRLIWARFVLHQDLQSVLRCHIAAFEAIGGAPRTILYDRMKTAVIGEDADGLVIYNRVLVDLARHYGFQPRACRPYRAKTKGKVERPFRHIREDFFLGGAFRNLDDLNEQLRHWLDTVANPRVHATTNRVVNEAFAEERASLKALPAMPYRAVLRLERRASHEGMVSVGGNLYSVPDTTRRRVFEVHVLADEVRIFEDGALVATHAPLEGRGEKRLDPSHRKPGSPCRRNLRNEPLILTRAGDRVVRRSLDFYAAVGRRLAGLGGDRARRGSRRPGFRVTAPHPCRAVLAGCAPLRFYPFAKPSVNDRYLAAKETLKPRGAMTAQGRTYLLDTSQGNVRYCPSPSPWCRP